MFNSMIERGKSLFVIQAFNGDTFENFVQCSITNGSNVWYRKDRNPVYRFKRLFVDTSGMYQPVNMAIDKAAELGHIPLIMLISLGRFSREVRGCKDGCSWHLQLPENQDFLVDKVWIPSDVQDWRRRNDLRSLDFPDRLKLFESKSPTVILQNFRLTK